MVSLNEWYGVNCQPAVLIETSSSCVLSQKVGICDRLTAMFEDESSAPTKLGRLTPLIGQLHTCRNRKEELCRLYETMIKYSHILKITTFNVGTRLWTEAQYIFGNFRSFDPKKSCWCSTKSVERLLTGKPSTQILCSNCFYHLAFATCTWAWLAWRNISRAASPRAKYQASSY